MKKIFVLGILMNMVVTFSQDLSDFKNLESEGQIPKDFLLSSIEKFESEVDQEISSEDDNKTKEEKELFLLKSSFQLRELLFSGKVLFNDTLSVYVKRVASELLKNDRKTYNDIRIYILKSSAVNAFTTNDGMIFITMGLLSQLENEAQLAFVLAHEVAHYKKKHVINKHVESSKEQSQFKNSTRRDAIIRSNKYSKELEIEADKEGYRLFKKTSYKKTGVSRVFDVLKYSYLPFDDLKFDTTMFQNGSYIFPKDYWIEEINQISASDNSDSEKSTHPSPEIRKIKIEKLISRDETADKGPYYIVGDQTTFEYLRNVARFELAKILLNEHNYKTAIYHIYLLKQQFENNTYLEKMMNFALYYQFRYDLISDYALVDRTHFHQNSIAIEGESHRVFHWIEKMPTKELGILALKTALENEQKYDDIVFKNMASDLMYLLVRDYDVIYESFESEYVDIAVDTVIKEVASTEPLTKLQKIKNKSKDKERDQDQIAEYYKYALVSLLKSDNDIQERFENAEKLATKTIEAFNNNRLLTNKELRKLERKGHSFGIDKMVVVKPEYNKVSNKYKSTVEYSASEKALIDLNNQIKVASDAANLDVEIIDDLSFKANEVDKLNDYVFLNNWLGHNTRFLEKSDTSLLVTLENDKIDQIISKYGTDYFCWTGFTGAKEKNNIAASVTSIGLSVFIFSLSPYPFLLSTGYTVYPKRSTSFYSIVLDLKTNKIVWGMSEKYNNKDYKMTTTAMLYNTYTQLKKKK